MWRLTPVFDEGGTLRPAGPVSPHMCPAPFDSLDWLPVPNEEGEVTGDIVILTLIPVGTE